MGSALARAFLSHGFSTQVWNRTAARCAPLAACGATVAGPAAFESAIAAGHIEDDFAALMPFRR
ncbi:hypothetical protein E8M01_29655 [Phreatobacter stygius]|uniref:6-phosphogluconate dehydrogenase NADP-binding domain-containing protein n=2 Tax=Phreatobacter stygius TaxID=1940610 RepID=A0A4D7BGH4_9HYPH|nr:hypothetical protein E8M01_29655 [Phreatobacter stygius]